MEPEAEVESETDIWEDAGDAAIEMVKPNMEPEPKRIPLLFMTNCHCHCYRRFKFEIRIQ